MISKQDNKTFIVFGLGPAGLFLSRQLHRMGCLLYGVGKEDDIGRYSNTLKKYFATEDIDSIRSIVNGLKKDNGIIRAYICSDQYLTMFLEEWPEIFSIISFEEPGQYLLERIADKENLIQFCKKNGMRFPEDYKTYEVDSSIHYPVAIKPNIKRGYSPIPKVSIIDNQEELIRFFRIAKQKGVEPSELIVQQYIPGNNSFEYGYGGYFKNGKSVLDVIFLQVRQYPQGVSCVTYEVEDTKDIIAIKELVAPFLRKTQYYGFLQFDIKKHADTGEFYVLDINPRPWGSISMLGPKCHSYSLFDPNFVPDKVKVKWRFPLKEVVSFKNRKNVQYKVLRKIQSRDFKTVIDLYDTKDKKPFFMQLTIAAKKAVKKDKNKEFLNIPVFYTLKAFSYFKLLLRLAVRGATFLFDENTYR